MTDDRDLFDALDPAQRTVATAQPVPRRKLGRGTVALLVLLRVYVVMAIPIVVYAFIHALRTPQ